MTTQTITRPATTTAPTVDPTQTAPVVRTWSRRAVSIALWTLQIVTAGVFVMAALPKLTADPVAVAGFNAMGFGVVGMYIIGALEVAGVLGLLIPRLTGLAASCLVALMIGAVTVTVLLDGVEMVALPATVGVFAATIAWGRRGSTAELVALVRRYTRQQATAH
jgi:uncharacterized membrane protein